MQDAPFRNADIIRAKTLLQDNKVRNLLFSEGTYQVEVADPKLKATFWPFFQLDDEGRIKDAFCTCSTAEKHKSCPHLAVAYLKIFNNHSEPLHVRFRDSLWNQLCQIGSRRHGYDPKVLKKTGQEFIALSATGKRLFYIKALKDDAKKRVNSLILKRATETEETSLKFSNLPAEELVLWREGKPSHHLQYELSFWSDLAKWWMQLQEKSKSYKITFEEEGKDQEVPLPKWIKVHFAEVEFGFYLSDVNWPQLIPGLATVYSPLQVFEFADQAIRKITFDPEKKEFHIDAAAPEKNNQTALGHSQEREVGEWIYVRKRGFYPKTIDPIFKEKVIPTSQVAYVLNRYPKILHKYLHGTALHRNPVQAQYQFYFDIAQNFHVRCYVFEPGDLQQKGSAYFGPWVYIIGKGFYILEGALFEGSETIVPKDQVSYFVNRYRQLLQSYEGFQTHLSNLESQLVYTLSKEGILKFDAHFEILEEQGEIIDLEDWLYVKGRGFYAKVSRRSGAVKPGTVVLPQDVAAFISRHKEELEQVQGFFSVRCPIEKIGLSIGLNQKNQIVVRPDFLLHSPYTAAQIRLFDNYVYVDKEGFSEIPSELRFPGAYLEEKMINASDEPYFIAYELDTLRSHAQWIEPRLRKPSWMYLMIHSIKKDKKKLSGEWVVELNYETDVGSVPVFAIWKGLQENKRYLFTDAGLILLKDLRFNWLKAISQKKWMKQGRFLRLNTMEWLKLSIFENIQEPKGTSKSAIESKKLFDELRSFQSAEPLDLTGLESQLRPYQEIGVRWLWFLYCRGLSGLLCDEMGLGKTHQAMALLAAAVNGNDKELKKKYLVVCPTSVIYHWEGLLKRFLPQLKVSVFYGTQRSLQQFESESDLLLTSYGTLRSEKKSLQALDFEIAIIDEIQSAKNPHSQTHKALRVLSAKMRLGLTGTPIENRLMELKALFDIVLPNYLPSEAAFKEHFINPIEKNQDAERKKLLSKLIRPFILRRKKTEVLQELPEKTEEISYCDLSEEQKRLYAEAFLAKKETLFHELHNERPASTPYMHIFALFSILKQICDHPCLITKQYSDFSKHKSGKWELFVELLEEARESNQKVVVFSQFLGMLDIIEAYLTEKKIGFAGIRGSTLNRREELERFRDDPECEVFVASLQAAGVGIDLVAASVVIHYDRWWNPAKENQATDRVHRIGQSRGVQVFKMVSKHTIEEHIHRMIERKMGLLEGVIGFDDHDRIKNLDRKELLELLHLISSDIEFSNLI